MCGIFGVIAKEEKYDRKELVKILEDVAKLSQVRGKDSSGFAVRFETKKQIDLLKGPVSIDKLLKTDEYKRLKVNILKEVKVEAKAKEKNINNVFAALGHARLVTNGSQLEDVNNQPVLKDGIVGIHNGIIVNENELWEKHSDLKRVYEIDTEILFALIRKFLNAGHTTSPVESEGYSTGIIQSSNLALSELFGTVSTGFMFNDRDEFVTLTNNGSLYILTNFKDLFIYASEKNILSLIRQKHNNVFNSSFILKQVPANTGFVIAYKDFSITEFDLLNESVIVEENSIIEEYKINIKNYHPAKAQLHAVVDPGKFTFGIQANTEKKLLEYNIDRISKLKRCTKCLLPETFPFVEFDAKGVCNICNNYVKKNQPKPIEELIELVEPYRRKDGQPDCLVPFSGGRDSTYVLHIVKNILKMNPIAFTYDWGMVTDLGRRNIARVTGKMGVENIIVSADIHWKRENIRKNILAWLQYPQLGMVPLFMAGDKLFVYYAMQVQKQNDIKLNIWGTNDLENTDFKVGFCGIPPKFDKKNIFYLSSLDKIKLFHFVFKNMMHSPHYFNSSIFDSIGSFISRSFSKYKGYHRIFDYIEWNEEKINEVLNDNKWEKAIDTDSTWRIGDGTSAFYNYIYYTVAGFSEIDTFLSNQIREEMIDRDRALELSVKENYPRYESLKWYLEIIGLDFERIIMSINKIPKLYS